MGTHQTDQTLTQEAPETGISSTKNTIPDTIDYIRSHQPHNNIQDVVEK
jgi:hypothetical protein